MKYTRLTKEQFEELTRSCWASSSTQTVIKLWMGYHKAENRKLSKNWMFFLIWFGRREAECLRHFSKPCFSLPFRHVFQSIVLKSLVPKLILSKGLQWLSDNMFTDNIDMKTGKRSCCDSVIFTALIQQGAVIASFISK
jgi:hypothetical protein